MTFHGLEFRKLSHSNNNNDGSNRNEIDDNIDNIDNINNNDNNDNDANNDNADSNGDNNDAHNDNDDNDTRSPFDFQDRSGFSMALERIEICGDLKINQKGSFRQFNFFQLDSDHDCGDYKCFFDFVLPLFAIM